MASRERKKREADPAYLSPVEGDARPGPQTVLSVADSGGQVRSEKDGDPRPRETPVADDPIPGDPTEADSFPPQWRYITSDAIRNVVKCSRRSGKTEGEIRRGRRFILRGKNVLYIGRVLKNVRHQFWIPFKDAMSRYGVAFKTNEQDLVLRPEAGGMLMGMSADDTKDIEKGRGYKWDLAMIDETQSFPDDVLEQLIDLILIPTLIDTGGALDLNGTPPDPSKGDSMRGYFVRTIRQAEEHPSSDPRKGWRLHSWTMFDNPFIPQENVEEAYAARGVGPGHPIWESEVMGRLVDNPAARVFPYDEARNGY